MTLALLGFGIAADRDPDCVADFLDEVSLPPTWTWQHIQKGQTAFRSMCKPGALLCTSGMMCATFDSDCQGCECCGQPVYQL